jgi:hypothetical protein
MPLQLARPDSNFYVSCCKIRQINTSDYCRSILSPVEEALQTGWEIIMRYYKGYVISGLIGLFVGIFATAWATHAIPKIISNSVLKIMTGMMGLMKDMMSKDHS